ncbi:MAG TPA: helix-turn-helix domain-containing protein [Streptosporangiaceae bacterium]
MRTWSRVGTTAQAARLAGKTPRTIRRWAEAGIVQAVRLGDRLVIDLTSVPRRQTSTSESGDTHA